MREIRCSERQIDIPRHGEPLTQFAFDTVEDLAQACQLQSRDLQALASANALHHLAGHRANAHWEVAGIESMPSLLADTVFDEAPVVLKAPEETHNIVADYCSLGLSMGRHPMALIRPQLARFKINTAEVLNEFPNGRLARASGLVTHRQRPATAKGVIFVTLEDETGQVNVIVWPQTIEQYRQAVLGAKLMTVYGVWQRDDNTGEVQHLVARRVEDHTSLLGGLATRSRDFR
jgi:error-prone DNA polymerase